MQSFCDDIFKFIYGRDIYLLRIPETVNHQKQKSLEKDVPPPNINPLIVHFVCGGFAGAYSRTITAPIDRIRLTVQTLSKNLKVTEVIHMLIKEGGVKSLWRGNLMNSLKVGPEMAIRFTIYEKMKYMMSDIQSHAILQRAIAGSCAGIIGNTFIYPLEVMKTRMTIRKTGEYSGVLHAIKKIYANEGIKAFYRGYATSCIGLIPFTGIDLALFETLKKKYVYKNPDNIKDRSQVLWKTIPCAITSTTVAQCTSYPFYLVKFRQQGISKHPSNLITKSYYFPWASIMTHIVKHEGVIGLYRGILPTLTKLIPASSIYYFTYECSQFYMRSYFNN